MKTFFLLFLLITTTHLNAETNIVTVRELFDKAASDKNSCYSLVSLTRNYSLEKNPLLYAYHAAAEMTMAAHEFWPATKLSHFNSGKWKLEAAVKKNPKNVEIRYIRYCVQQGTPFFLNYSSDIAADRKYVLDNIDLTDWPASYKKKVREFMVAA